jgi:hypothetical protein
MPILNLQMVIDLPRPTDVEFRLPTPGRRRKEFNSRLVTPIMLRWHWTDVGVVNYFDSMLEKILSPTMPNGMVYASSHTDERD